VLSFNIGASTAEDFFDQNNFGVVNMKRLTVFLTVVFAVALSVVSVFGVEQTVNAQNLPAWVSEAGLRVIPDVMGEVAVLEMGSGSI